MDNALNFTNINEWRDWLDQNHDKKDYVWLLYHKKTSIKRGLCLGESVEEAICFGWIDGKIKKINNERYKKYFSSRREDSEWSENNKKIAMGLIKKQLIKEQGFQAINASKRKGKWVKKAEGADYRKLTGELGKELKGSSKEAFEKYLKLSLLNQKQLAGFFCEAKQKETRDKRLKKIIERIIDSREGILY